MDFAFAPGVSPYDVQLKRLYKNRPQTTLVDRVFVDTFRSFVAHLNRNTAAHPTRFVMVGSHGDDNAYMQLQFDGARGPHTTWEDLDAADTNKTCELTDDVTIPRPLDAANNPIPPFVLIKGCRIGISQPFMTKMKEAFNGASTETINVCAPRYFHVLGVHASGLFEHFSYDHGIVTKTKFANKTALVAAFLAKQFKDLHQVEVTEANYKKWIPEKIHKIKNDIQSIIVKNTPIPKFTSFTTGRYKYAFVEVIHFNFDFTVTPVPADDAGKLQLVKTKLADFAANPGGSTLKKSLQAAHLFPFFTRFGYSSIDDMVDNLVWKFEKVNDIEMIARGKRHEYNVNPPVVDTNNKDLFYNFFPDPGSGFNAVTMFDERDPRFYVTT